MAPDFAGPAGAVVALAFVLFALIRGDLVPGWIFRSEQAQRIKAETQAERNAEALAELAKAAARDNRGA